MATTKTRPPRRLSPLARREQLVEAATAEIAGEGFAEFSLDAVAERAGVTRNLLYHYFPRGRLDLFLATLDRAGSELTEGWVLDSDLPATERTAANLERVKDDVMTPSDAWLVYRQARGLADPEVQAMLRHYGDVVISSVARNQLGTSDPSPLARVALGGYLAYVETALDEARERGVGWDAVRGLLVETLTPTLKAVSPR
jgi:AcrR family transcriptional regulator